MDAFIEKLNAARKIHKTSGDGKDEGKRFREILGILMKHDLKNGVPPESAVSILQDLGPTFVKLGQIVSTHSDILPPEYCEALGKLRTNAAPMSLDDVRSQIETELGKPLEDIFDDFDETAVGSASIAQVHRAKLKDGTQVAVKVQRPGVVETVSEDLAIMERVTEIYSFVTGENGQVSLKDLVDEMVQTSTSELNFLNEADNMDRFLANCEVRDGVTCPRCYREISTSAILVEDFAESPCAEKIDDLSLSDEERDAIAYAIAQNYMQQIMEDGFYHADPHAGNILISEDQEIEWIDFGMMGEMSSSQRAVLMEMITAIAHKDAYGLKRSLLRVAVPTRKIDQSELLAMCDDVMDRFIGTDLEGFDTGVLFDSLLNGMQGHGLKVDPFLTNLSRGLVTLEGTIFLISPRLNIMQVVVDYIASTITVDQVKKQARHFMGRTVDGAEALVDLPTKATDTLDMLQKGEVKVGLDFLMGESLDREIRGAGAIVALSFIAAALIIGSCILGASGRGIYIGNISLEGSFGLVLGAVILVFVIIKSWRYLK